MKRDKETKSYFVRVRCSKCKNEQNVFSNIASKVYCLVCNEPLAESRGGRSRIIGEVLEVLR